MGGLVRPALSDPGLRYFQENSNTCDCGPRVDGIATEMSPTGIVATPSGRPGRTRKVDIDLRLALDNRATPAWRCDPASRSPQPSRGEIVALAESLNGRVGSLLAEGGELLKRSDLLEVLRDLALVRPDRLGICTAGEGLTAAAARSLRAAGVQRAQVPVCCARQDANDWLMKRPGALKLARTDDSRPGGSRDPGDGRGPGDAADDADIGRDR